MDRPWRPGRASSPSRVDDHDTSTRLGRPKRSIGCRSARGAHDGPRRHRRRGRADLLAPSPPPPESEPAGMSSPRGTRHSSRRLATSHGLHEALTPDAFVTLLTSPTSRSTTGISTRATTWACAPCTTGTRDGVAFRTCSAGLERPRRRSTQADGLRSEVPPARSCATGRAS